MLSLSKHREPCIQAFLNSLEETFQYSVQNLRLYFLSLYRSIRSEMPRISAARVW